MKRAYKYFAFTSLRILLCLFLAIPANAQHGGGGHSGGGGGHGGGGFSGGGGGHVGGGGFSGGGHVGGGGFSGGHAMVSPRGGGFSGGGHFNGGGRTMVAPRGNMGFRGGTQSFRGNVGVRGNVG